MKDDAGFPAIPLETVAARPVRKILPAIFLEVFIGFFKDMILATFGLLKKYFELLQFYTLFLLKPKIDNYSLHREKGLRYSKYTFELILIATAVVIFLIKVNVIKSSSDELTELYNNDLAQWGMELVIFLVYTGWYFLVLILLILLGRLLRIIFRPAESAGVTDILFIHLNNIYFILAAAWSFYMRFSYSDRGMDLYDYSHFVIEMTNSFGVVLLIAILVFFIRFAMVNKLTVGKTIIYVTIIPTIAWAFLLGAGLMLSAFMLGL